LMTNSRRTRTKRNNVFDLAVFWQELQENLSREALGLFVFLAGGYLGFSLLVAGESAWIARVAGWTGGLITAVLLILGVVLMVGDRAGYWNPEALVGAELLLLSLQAGTFVVHHEIADWTRPAGDSAGWLGWGLGNLLVGGLGRWPAAMTI